jgi:hypothetical protein
VALASSTTVTASFVADMADKIGVYRPSTGEWFLDRNGNETWDGCDIDLCLSGFAGASGKPVVGDWNGSGSTKIGLFVSAANGLRLDQNGNNTWDGCEVDICTGRFGENGDLPIAGHWTTTGHDQVAAFRPKQKKWLFDSNRDGSLNCRQDECRQWSNYQSGDLPVTGDWTGDGKTLLGLFRPRTGEWFLDKGNAAWNGCGKEICLKGFGTKGDLPVSGDWDGTGKSKIGVFRPSTGEWFLDLNGNGKWDGCGVDGCLPQFGMKGDIPVAGKW